MLFVENHKKFSTSGHAVVTLTDKKYKTSTYMLETFACKSVQKITQCLLLGTGVVWHQVL